MANNLDRNPMYVDTAAEILTGPTKVLSMRWTNIVANGDDLITSGFVTNSTGQAGVPQDIINQPTVIPKLTVATIDSGILEITVE